MGRLWNNRWNRYCGGRSSKLGDSPQMRLKNSSAVNAAAGSASKGIREGGKHSRQKATTRETLGDRSSSKGKNSENLVLIEASSSSFDDSKSLYSVERDHQETSSCQTPATSIRGGTRLSLSPLGLETPAASILPLAHHESIPPD